jgi:alpha-tubulin N-acetyltransferase 1
MEFNFDCVQSLGCDENGFAILEGSYQNRIVPGYILFVKEILNSMGEASSRAQQLNTTITSAHKFFISNHRIFIKAEQNKVLGFIKVGSKKLFLRDRNYNYHEVNALCVLDFYVHESTQRRGIGKQLFDYMLKFEKKIPTELAYDRPSPKLLSFLRKHFGLTDFIQQNNNYVVFDEFFNYIANNLTYDNSTNRAIRAIPNNDNNINISNNNNYQQSNFNLSKSQNFNNPNLVNVGQNLIYNNSFDNKVINKEVYKNPVTGFQQYY